MYRYMDVPVTYVWRKHIYFGESVKGGIPTSGGER